MRKAAVILLCALAACRPSREAAAPRKNAHTVIIPEDETKKRRVDKATTGPTLIDQAFFGTQLGTDGAVAANSVTAAEGEPLYLTLRLRDSPPGLRIGVIWKDARGKKIAVEERDMNGSRMATFALPQKLVPGHYSVESYWGATPGRVQKFEVIGKTKPSR